MKTIEERAKEYSDRHKSIENSYFNKGYNYYIAEKYDAEKFAYEAGAYDQKTIDDAELLKFSQGNCGTMLEKLREYLRTSSQEDLDAKYNELSEFLSTEHVTTVYDEANYQQGYHDAIEKARKWLKEHIYEYIAVGNTDFGKPYDIHLCSEELFDDFPKAMEE